MRSKKPFLAAAAMGLGLLTGCVSFQVDDHSYQFNEATGSLGLRLLLLNAVRASKDYPLQFTKISGYQGQGTSSASLSASLPLSSSGTGSITPRVDVKDGISELTLVDLSTAEAQEDLKKTISWDVYANFYRQIGNRSYIAPFILMTESITMDMELHNLITRYVKRKCNVYLSKSASQFENYPRFPNKEAACLELRVLEDRCPGLFATGFMTVDSMIIHKNETTSECHFNAFIAARLQLAVIVAAWSASEEEKPEKDKAPDKLKRGPGNTFNIFVTDSKNETKKPAKILRLGIFDPEFAELCIETRSKRIKELPSKRSKKSPSPPTLCVPKPQGYALVQTGHVTLQLRTPERMVRYLGDLISAQSYGPKRFIPEVLDYERREKFKLLTVTRGIAPLGGAVVSVRAPDGEMFYVPGRDPDAPKKDISLETLSIVTEILNAAVSRKAFPPVTSLTVRSD